MQYLWKEIFWMISSALSCYCIWLFKECWFFCFFKEKVPLFRERFFFFFLFFKRAHLDDIERTLMLLQLTFQRVLKLFPQIAMAILSPWNCYWFYFRNIIFGKYLIRYLRIIRFVVKISHKLVVAVWGQVWYMYIFFKPKLWLLYLSRYFSKHIF